MCLPYLAGPILFGVSERSAAQPLADIARFFGLNTESIVDIEREGFAFLMGIDRPVDYQRAVPLLEQAAAAGRPASLGALADVLWFGRAGTEDRARAFDLFTQAALLGDANSQLFLGYAYEAGEFVATDLEQAHRFNEAAASQGHPAALLRLARLYGNGRGVPDDDDIAFDLLVRAAELGDIVALKTTGFGFLRDPSRLDYERGLYFLQQIAADDDYAAFEVGWAHLTGRIRSADPGQGAEWVDQAAKKRFKYAGMIMAELLDRGFGVDQNPALAASMRASVLEASSPVEKNALAWNLATSQHEFARNGPVAAELMEELLALPDMTTAARLDTLAAAYAESGRFSEAIETQLRALEMMREIAALARDRAAERQDIADQADSGLAEASARLGLYRAGNPYRRDD